MTFLIVSFLAGVLTVLAPCILPLLPVVLGTSAAGRSRATPYVVVGSLAASIIIFTYALKASTAFVMLPPQFFTYLSGGILVLFGIILVFPTLWERLPFVAKLSVSSNKVLGSGWKRHSLWGDAIVGASLGPIFSTCSPTYFVILASVLPVSFALGSLYLLAYVIGLSLVLLAIAFLGQRFATRLAVLSDSRGRFKRAIGVIFLVLGLLIATGYEKKLETAILNSGFLDVTKLEQKLLQRTESDGSMLSETKVTPYQEIVDPSGFVNTEGITIGELIGKKVILIDFMTYSCINCVRTFPYLNAWYEKYESEGLVIIGIHTPEFAFEHDIDNVRQALDELGIKFPVVLDNDYATWRAYGNKYWPRKYLIDINGNIVYDHIGEGKYEETEMKIRELLIERAQVLGESGAIGSTLAATAIPEAVLAARSPETYFGSDRNEYLGNGAQKQKGEQTLVVPEAPAKNQLYLGGTWRIDAEYAEAGSDATVVYRYNAKNVYLVMESDAPAEVEVWQDGAYVKTITVTASTLYTLLQSDTAGEHTLELRLPAGVRTYAFTFG